ncbi:MAG TPA: outer membrane protein assembly factor BamD [Steroidobacteraceae bacterium]|nr:outer membrane protein assembly factor BamD [Steroidobacteraceae bacterium]
MHRSTVSLRGLLAALLGALVLAGCAGSGTATQQRLARFGPDALYDQGRRALISSNWLEAVNVFEALNARYALSAHARQGRVDVIYAYYRLGEKESARDAADTFIRENPADPRVDYAYYLRGLVDFERTQWTLERWLNVDLAERVPQTARDSFESLRIVVNDYPNSKYAPDARQRMIYLRNRLADYELRVAEHYMERGAWVAAAQRARQAIEQFDGAPAVKDALRIMIHCYTKLGYTDLAGNSERVFRENFPDESTALSRSSSSWWKPWQRG